MANKVGRNKKWCEKYKQSGRREENKRIRQKRDEKRREKFVKRREEGKTYQYSKANSAAKIQEAFADIYDMKSKQYKEMEEILVRNLFAPNQGSNQGKHQEYSRRRSIERKLNDEMTRRKNEAKKRADKENDRKAA